MSILEQLSQKADIFRNLWVEFQSLPEKLRLKRVIFQGTLLLPSKNSGFMEVEMFLTKSGFYYFSDQGTIFFAYLKWCLLETFTEESGKNPLMFGFSLKKSEATYDFFTTSEAELISWVNHLSFIVTMSNFDEYYITLKNIDSGQFGNVDLCLEIDTKLNFAVKKIKKAQLSTPKSQNLVFNEIKIQKKLDHPSIVQLFKIFEDSEFVYLVMEYVEEGNLLKRIIRQPEIAQFEVMVFTRNMLEVVSYMHSKGIIHRDLKPENILVTSKDSICTFKVADFGLSCYVSQHESTCTGSPGYIAPEILRGSPYNSKVDIFSVGVTVFILLTGCAPFGATNPEEILRKNLKCEIQYNSLQLRNISMVARKFLMKILKADPELRPSAEEMLNNEWFRERKFSDPETTSTTLRNEAARDFSNFGRVADRYLRH